MRFRLGDAETLPRRLQRGRHLVKAVTKEGTLRALGRGWESVGLFIVYPRILWFCLYSFFKETDNNITNRKEVVFFFPF